MKRRDTIALKNIPMQELITLTDYVEDLMRSKKSYTPIVYPLFRKLCNAIDRRRELKV